MQNKVLLPTFSIITICLNNKDGLVRTYNSLKMQSCDDYEWIVVDGVSTDGTVEFLKSLPKTDKILWKSEADSGLYDAMNKGMALATGDYLLFLNSGDELVDSSILSEVKNAAEKFSFPGLIYGDAYEFDENQNLMLKKAYSHNRIWYGMFAHHQAMFFHKKYLPKKYNTQFVYASDYEFVASHLNAGANVKCLPITICKFESGGISQTGSTKVADLEQWDVRERIFKYSWVKCFGVYLLHKFVHLIKKLMPFAYRYMRFNKVKN